MYIKIFTASMCAILVAIVISIVGLFWGANSNKVTAQLPTPAVTAERKAPSANNNPMTPVNEDEAARRIELHQIISDEKSQKTAAAIAPPVITEVRQANPDDPLAREIFDFPTTPEPERTTQVKKDIFAATTDNKAQNPLSNVDINKYRNLFDQKKVSRANWGQTYNFKKISNPIEIRDLDFKGRSRGRIQHDNFINQNDSFLKINENIKLSWSLHSLNKFEPFMIVADIPNSEVQQMINNRTNVYDPNILQGRRGYSSPQSNQRSAARPAMVDIDEAGNVYTTSDEPNGFNQNNSNITIYARSGDFIYARLMYGFNSDDVRGLPIYAILNDYLPNGTAGPLNNARVQGQVSFSAENAAIIFNKIILPNGTEKSISAIAVSAGDARTGIAKKVNRHIIERYGSLFLGGLIQGVGDVALEQIRSKSSNGGTTIVIGDTSGNVNSNQKATDTEIVAGALAPVGSNLSAAAIEKFNKPATISAPANMPFALIFTDTLIHDPSSEVKAFNPRTQSYENIANGSNIRPKANQQSQGAE